ncbi:MAG: hypothetical protein ACYSTF_08005 [Planctomycetota bacterium]|jgi:hypothetical protein
MNNRNGQRQRGFVRGAVLTLLGILSWFGYVMVTGWSAAPAIPEETKKEYVELGGELGELQREWRDLGERLEKIEERTKDPCDLAAVRELRKHHSEVSKTLKLFERLLLVNATPRQKALALFLLMMGLGLVMVGVRRLVRAVRDWELAEYG